MKRFFQAVANDLVLAIGFVCGVYATVVGILFVVAWYWGLGWI